MIDKDNVTGKEVDYVNNPPYYHTGQIECIEAMSLKKEKFSSSFSDRFAKSLDEGLADGPDAVPENLAKFAAGIRNPILEAFGIKDSSSAKRKL